MNPGFFPGCSSIVRWISSMRWLFCGRAMLHLVKWISREMRDCLHFTGRMLQVMQQMASISELENQIQMLRTWNPPPLHHRQLSKPPPLPHHRRCLLGQIRARPAAPAYSSLKPDFFNHDNCALSRSISAYNSFSCFSCSASRAFSF